LGPSALFENKRVTLAPRGSGTLTFLAQLLAIFDIFDVTAPPRQPLTRACTDCNHWKDLLALESRREGRVFTPRGRPRQNHSLACGHSKTLAAAPLR